MQQLLFNLFGGFERIKTNILLPLLGRLGTATAAALVGYGVQGDLAQQIATGLVALGLVLYDLLVDWMNRARAVRKAK